MEALGAGVNLNAFSGQLQNSKILGHHSKMDIIYIVDGSTSVGKATFDRDIKRILERFTQMFDVGPNTHHIAFIQFFSLYQRIFEE